MRFIVDESSGRAVAESLRALGHDVLAVPEVMLSAHDHDILSRAASEGRILITNDKDFGELVFRNGGEHCGVVLLRLHDESASNRVRVAKAIVEQYGERLVGRFVVGTDAAVRFYRPRERP